MSENIISFSVERTPIILNPAWFIHGGIVIYSDHIEYLNMRRERVNAYYDAKTTEFILSRTIQFNPLHYAITSRFSKTITDEVLTDLGLFREALISIDADSVSINLSGYSLENGESGRFICPSMAGISISSGKSYIKIYNGTIRNFNCGIIGNNLWFAEFERINIDRFIARGISVKSAYHCNLKDIVCNQDIIHHGASEEWVEMCGLYRDSPRDAKKRFNILQAYNRWKGLKTGIVSNNMIINRNLLINNEIVGIDMSEEAPEKMGHHCNLENISIRNIILWADKDISSSSHEPLVQPRLTGINIHGLEQTRLRNLFIENIRREPIGLGEPSEIGIKYSKVQRDLLLDKISISRVAVPELVSKNNEVRLLSANQARKKKRIIRQGCACKNRNG